MQPARPFQPCFEKRATVRKPENLLFISRSITDVFKAFALILPLFQRPVCPCAKYSLDIYEDVLQDLHLHSAKVSPPKIDSPALATPPDSTQAGALCDLMPAARRAGAVPPSLEIRLTHCTDLPSGD